MCFLCATEGFGFDECNASIKGFVQKMKETLGTFGSFQVEVVVE